jgi:hypothetical protein
MGMELVGKVEKVLTYMLSVIRNIIYDARDVSFDKIVNIKLLETLDNDLLNTM